MGEVTVLTFREGGNGNQTRTYPLHNPIPLVIPEEEYLVVLDRSADGPPELILNVSPPGRIKVVAAVEVGIAEKFE